MGNFFDGGVDGGGGGYRGNGNPGMQTLGAKNEFVRNNRQRSTLDMNTKRPSKGPAPTPPQGSGMHNSTFKNDSDDEQQHQQVMGGGGNSRNPTNTINLSLYESTPKNGSSMRRGGGPGGGGGGGGGGGRELNNSEV